MMLFSGQRTGESDAVLRYSHKHSFDAMRKLVFTEWRTCKNQFDQYEYVNIGIAAGNHT